MCISDWDLSAFVDGELGEVQQSNINEHLEICTTCRKRVQTFNEIKNKVRIPGIEIDQFVKDTVWTRLYHSTSTSKDLDFWHRGFTIAPSLMVSLSFVFLAAIGMGLFWIIPDINNMNSDINKSDFLFVSGKFPVEIPVDNIETILAHFDINDEPLEVSIQLPDASSFAIWGEARFLRKADYIAGR